jgi:hypothetical protein
LVNAIVEALRSAGATEEIIASAVKAGGEFAIPHPGGRPRKHANAAERVREHRKRKRNEIRNEIPLPCNETGFVTPPPAPSCNETGFVTPDTHILSLAEVKAIHAPMALGPALRGRLEEAGQGHFDANADVAPICGLLDRGCDLEADILPTVARTVPELPRPLRNWGAPWLVREILAAREQRLGVEKRSKQQNPILGSNDQLLEAPPPARRTPAIAWDEFVAGHRAGLIEWNTARLSPKPREPGCRAPAEVLREHGY